MIACPNKNNTLYKQVEAIYGEDAAYEMYYRIQQPEFDKWYDGIQDKEGNPKLTSDFTFVNSKGEALDLKPFFQEKNLRQKQAIEVIEKMNNELRLDKVTHKYYKGQHQFAISPTDISKQRSKEINKGKELTPEQIIEFQQAADDGNKIHSYIENIINSEFKGEKREIPKDAIDKAIYDKLDTYFTSFSKEAKDRGSILIPETTVYDEQRDIAGTVDLIEVHKDGRLSIYDYKTLEFKVFKTIDGISKVSEIHPLKIKEYDTQINEYKKILKKKGFDNKSFDKLRVIPIRRNYKVHKVGGEWKKLGLSSIEIGTKTVIDGKELERDYLNMIPVANENTEDVRTNKLLDKLRNEIKVLGRQIKKEPEKIKRDALYQKESQINDSIRHILLNRNYASLVENAEVEINDYLSKINSLTSVQLLNGLRVSDFYSDIQQYLPEISSLLVQDEGNLFVHNLSHLQVIAKELHTKLEEKGKKYLDELEIRKRVNTGNLFTPQKETGTIAKLFRSISQINHPLFQLFYQMVQNQKDKANNESEELRKKIQDKINALKEWGMINKVSDYNLFDKIIKTRTEKDGTHTTSLINQYSDEFYKARKENKALTGVSINKERFDKAITEYKDKVHSTTYVIYDKEKNKQKQEEYIQNYIKRNSNSATANIGLLDFENTQWNSPEWLELQKSTNKALKEFYELYTDTIGGFQNFLPHNIKKNFIPNVHKGLIEQGLKLEDASLDGLRSNLLETIQVKEQDVLYGSINPTTGEQDFRIPLLFVGELKAEEKSRDLGTSLMLFAQSALNYKYMSEIEEDTLLVYNELKSQKVIATNKYGNTIKDANNNVVLSEPEANSATRKQFQDFLNYYIYGIKTTTGDTTFEYKRKQLSATKIVKTLMSYFSTKSLSLNTISGLVSTIGDMSNAYIQGARGKYYNSKQMSKAIYLRASNDNKAKALIQLFDSRLDKKEHKRANDLSVSGLNKTLTRDKFYIIQDIGGNAVQDGILLAMLQNYGKDKQGKIRLLKDSLGKSLYDESNEEGKLSLSDDEKELFKRKVKAVVKNVLGNTSDDDISTIRLILGGQILMMFRNWIPRTVDERIGELRYNQDLESYELGRYRYFFNNLLNGNAIPVLTTTIRSLLFLSAGQNFSKVLEQNYLDAKQKAEDRGEEFNISLDEYVELEKQNIKATARELQIILAVLATIFALGAADDKDKKKGAIHNYILKTLNRLYSELFFYLNPIEFVKIIKSPIPIIGIFTETITLFKQMALEPFTEDKENKPGEGILKLLPGVNGILKAQEIVEEGNKEYLQK